MPGPIMTIATLFQGWLYGHNDETSYVSKKSWKDAIKDRMGMWKTDVYGWLGARSYNIYDGSEQNPDQYEKFLVGVRHDDDFPKHVEAFEYAIMGHYPGERGDMSTKRNDFLRITSRYIEAYGKKVWWNDQTADAFRQGVVDLYQALLGRAPESEAVIEEWRAGSAGDLQRVREGIMGSPEYQAKHSA